MPGKNSCLIALESHKQILIAESELNRALLGREYRAITSEIKGLTHGALRLCAIAVSAKMLLTGVFVLLSNKSRADARRHSWLSTIFTGLREAASIWLASRERSP